MPFELNSTAIQQGATIPQKYTADGRNLSPPLKWTDPPTGTRSLAVVCEDPDAPRRTFTHWIVYNLPPESRQLDEGVPVEAPLPSGAVQGANDFGNVGYGGPAPPPGKPHRYNFKLLALDNQLDLEPGADKKQFLSASKGHVLTEAQLTAQYGR